MEVLKGVHLLRDDFVNIYLLFRDGDVVVIDTGITGKPLIDYIDRKGLEYDKIKLIILTHHHFDHTGGLKILKERVNAQIASHREEAVLIKEKTGISPTVLLEDNQIIYDLLVIHTPGHTPGHIVLLDQRTKALFIGDLVYEDKGQLHEIPHKYSLNPDMNRESIKKLLGYDFKHVMPSHGKPIIGEGKDRIKELVMRLDLTR